MSIAYNIYRYKSFPWTFHSISHDGKLCHNKKSQQKSFSCLPIHIFTKKRGVKNVIRCFFLTVAQLSQFNHSLHMSPCKQENECIQRERHASHMWCLILFPTSKMCLLKPGWVVENFFGGIKKKNKNSSASRVYSYACSISYK